MLSTSVQEVISMDNAIRPQHGLGDMFTSLVVESYAWLITLTFGATLLDMVYAASNSQAGAGPPGGTVADERSPARVVE